MFHWQLACCISVVLCAYSLKAFQFQKWTQMCDCNQSPFLTIKAAKEAGFRRKKDYEYGGEEIRVKGVELVRNPLVAQSKTAWRKKGRKVLENEIEHASRCGRVRNRVVVEYSVYREDQTVPLVRRSPPAPALGYNLTQENVLCAIFTVNRSAKRERDAAQSCYQCGSYGFATMHREKKESLYSLKDRGIVYAFSHGWLRAECMHGPLTVYRCQGYCFHSFLCPEGEELPLAECGPIFVESRPRTSQEMLLPDAKATLETLPVVTTGFSRRAMSQLRPSSPCFPRAGASSSDPEESGDENFEPLELCGEATVPR